MRYDAFETLVAPARPSAGLLYLTGGLVLTMVLFMTLGAVASSLPRGLLPPEAWARLSRELATASTPRGVLINLFFFALLIAALAAALRLVHRRRLITLIGPWGRALRQFRRAALAVLALYVAVTLVPAGPELAPEPNLSPGRWLALLPLALAGLLIQTSAEELLFRGYLQSQLAARFAHPAIWIGLPSAGFAALHHDPTLGAAGNGWLVMLWAGAFGIAAADLTARAGTLGPAIALHFTNNLSAILLAAPEGSFDGLALYTFPFSLSDKGALAAWAPVEFLMLFCAWLVVRITLRR